MSPFTEHELATVYRAMRERRDMRHFLPDPVDPLVLTRLLEAAHPAPMLELEGWTRRAPLQELVFHDTWGNSVAPGTLPPATLVHPRASERRREPQITIRDHNASSA